ncbi:MAG: type II CAAX endopeptidase family protein [Anaerolineales bacterium]|jgi:membrane protease YdiL (CAAX protease family)
MKKITNWIKHHQLIAFFLITFAISWGLGFSYYAINNPGQEFLFPLAAVATCGPALAGIIVTKICNTEPMLKSRKSFWIAFPTALVISTVVFLAQNVIINKAPLSPIMLIFLIIMAIPVAYVLSAVFSRVPSLRRYLASVYQVRRVWVWLLLAPIVMLGLDLLSIALSHLLGRHSVTFPNLSIIGPASLKLMGITFLYQLFFFNLTGEEIGWRGFALPRLLSRTSPIIASLVLTFFWAIWHVFYWDAGGEPVSTMQYWLDTFVRLFPATVLINWFYMRSKGSILVAGVLHAVSNTFFQYIPLDWPVHTATMYGCALLIILIDQWWRKLPEDSSMGSQAISWTTANMKTIP